MEYTLDEMNEIREESKQAIELNKALNRLHDNADFKLVFLNGYLEKEAVRLVKMLADRSVTGATPNKALMKEDYHECMIGIARFNEYLLKTKAMAQMAENNLISFAEAEKKYYASLAAEESYIVQDENVFTTNSEV